VGLEYNVEMI